MPTSLLRFATTDLIGAGAGAIVSYFGRRTSGTCPVTSTAWRGALHGESIGLTVA